MRARIQVHSAPLHFVTAASEANGSPRRPGRIPPMSAGPSIELKVCADRLHYLSLNSKSRISFPLIAIPFHPHLERSERVPLPSGLQSVSQPAARPPVNLRSFAPPVCSDRT